jgi:hypothetical protein
MTILALIASYAALRSRHHSLLVSPVQIMHRGNSIWSLQKSQIICWHVVNNPNVESGYWRVIMLESDTQKHFIDDTFLNRKQFKLVYELLNAYFGKPKTEIA